MIPGDFKPLYKWSAIITDAVLRVLNRYDWIQFELKGFVIFSGNREMAYEFKIRDTSDIGVIRITECYSSYSITMSYQNHLKSLHWKCGLSKPGFRRFVTSFFHRLRPIYKETVISNVMNQ